MSVMKTVMCDPVFQQQYSQCHLSLTLRTLPTILDSPEYVRLLETMGGLNKNFKINLESSLPRKQPIHKYLHPSINRLFANRISLA